MRILIAGAGYVGLALARAMSGEHEVFALRRSRPDDVPDGVQVVVADLTNPSSLADLPEVDAVAVTVSSDERSPEAYERAYVSSLLHLRSQLEVQSIRPKRWIFTSSTAVYGDSGGDWVDEGTSTDPSGFAGETLLRGERVVLEASWEGVVVRLGGIYGPGRTRLLDQVRSGEASIPPDPVYTNRIHRDDAAGALCHLLLHPSPDSVYLGVDDDPAERGVVLRWLAERLGAPEPQVGTRESIRGNKRCRNDRLRASGYDLLYPTFREGYDQVIRAS